MTRTIVVCLLAVLFAQLGCAAETQSILIEDSFCRGGQVFLHWSDCGTAACYHIYRHSQPITISNKDSADLICDDALPGSAKDLVASYVAERKGQPDPEIGLRLSDLGLRLNPDDGLWVHTAGDAGSFYYAVVAVDENGVEAQSIVLGENSLAAPIEQSVADPVPVLDETGTVTDYQYPYRTYILYRRDDQCLADGEATKFCVTTPPNYDPNNSYPVLVVLHHYGYYHTPIAWGGTITLSPCDFISCLPYTHNTWWYGCCENYPDVSSGTVRNYTEQMLLSEIDWLKENYHVDENRVFVQGGSMGASGALSFGLRHPEVFAAILAMVPQVDPGDPSAGFQGQLEDIWGSVEDNLPTNDGIGVWDRMDMASFVGSHTEDLPFVKVFNHKNDTTLPWPAVPGFYDNLDESRHAAIIAWGQNGHSASTLDLPQEFAGFNIYNNIRRNRSCPVINNSTGNQDPGNGDPMDGDDIGQMNSGYEWQILADSPAGWSVSICYTPGGDVTADISARRLQQFFFDEGQMLCYVVRRELDGSIVDSGCVTAEREDFFVLPCVPLSGENRVLTVYKASCQLPADFDALADGAAVELNLLHVTAVFDDVCYAETDERYWALGILNACDVAEGDVIDVAGTKVGCCGRTIQAENVCVRGSDSPVRPLGLAQEQPLCSGGICTDCLLVRTWGMAGESEGDQFTIDFGFGPLVIYGEFGSAPPVGAFVSVTGICGSVESDGQTVPGIRVRDASDIAVY